MSIYRIEFTYREKQYNLKASELDMTHPYFVSLRKLIMPEEKVIINPEVEDVRRLFGRTEQLMIPLQNIELIEVFNDDPDSPQSEKLRTFSVIEKNDQQ